MLDVVNNKHIRRIDQWDGNIADTMWMRFGMGAMCPLAQQSSPLAAIYHKRGMIHIWRNLIWRAPQVQL